MLRYLRIAVTVLSLTACVLLIALWVRSYWQMNQLVWRISPTEYVAFTSIQSALELGMSADPDLRTVFTKAWTSGGFALEDWDAVLNSPTAFFPATAPGPHDTAIMRWPHFSKSAFIVPSGAKYLEISVPYWLVVTLNVAMASLLWLRWRFRLRTLLIATTLVAVVLGMIMAF